MREWELERARLREMERVGESDTPDVEQETEHLPIRRPSQLGDIMPPVPPSPGIVFSVLHTPRLHGNGYPHRCTFLTDQA